MVTLNTGNNTQTPIDLGTAPKTTELSLQGSVSNAKFKEFLAKHIKQEQVSPVIQACENLFGKTVDVQDFSLVTGGRNTSKIIRFKALNKEYVCRATDSTRTGFYIDVPSEVRIVKIVDAANLTPKTLFNDSTSGIIIMDYVPSIRLTSQILADTQGTEFYVDLAQRLRALHSGADFTDAPTNIFKDVEKTAKAGEASLMPPLALDTLQEILKLEPIFKKYQKNVPSHKDLTSNNILYDGKRTYFIDWEMAANCDAIFDLAVMSVFYIFDSKKEEAYLKSYFQADPTQQQKAYFYLMKQLAFAFWSFKHLRRVTVGANKMDLSKEDFMNMKTLPKFQDFMLETFNGCSKVFTYDDLKLASYMFLREAVNNMKSEEYTKAVELLTEPTSSSKDEGKASA